MPLASANFAPVSTVPWELKGRGGACQDAGAPENGCLVKNKNLSCPPSAWHLSPSQGLMGIVVFSDSKMVCMVYLSHGGAGTWGFKEPGLRNVV